MSSEVKKKIQVEITYIVQKNPTAALDEAQREADDFWRETRAQF
jgi:hypothetical protein